MKRYRPTNTGHPRGPGRRAALRFLGVAPLAGLLSSQASLGVFATVSTGLAGEAAAAPGPAAPAGPRYYLKIRAVELSEAARATLAIPAEAPASPAQAAVPDGGTAAAVAAAADAITPDAVAAQAKDMLLAALRKRPEVLLELDGKEADPAQAVAEIKRRGVKGYEVTLRVLRLDRAIRPPPAGRKFRLLERNAKLSLVGTTFPGEFLALGGDGESTVQIDVGAQVSDRQERDVLDDALQDAISQAVSQAMRKLQAGQMKPPKDPPRKKPATAPKK